LKVSLSNDIKEIVFDKNQELENLKKIEEAVQENNIEEDLTQTTQLKEQLSNVMTELK
jgi:hypothetical protein